MNCKDFERLVPLYHDGELDGEKRREFEAHLSSCPECQKMLSSIKALDALVRDGDAEKIPDPGEHYWQNFSKRLSHKLSEPRHLALRHSRPKLFGLRLIPYLSAGVAVVFGVIIGIELLEKAPGRFSELSKIEQLGPVKVEQDEGVSRKNMARPASPLSREGAPGRQDDFAEADSKLYETQVRGLGQEDIVATGSAASEEEVEALSGLVSAEVTAAKDETVKPEEKAVPTQNLASKEEEVSKPSVTAVTTKQSPAPAKDADDGKRTVESKNVAKTETKTSTGGTAVKTPALGAATEAQKAATIAVDKTSYPKGTIVFDRQFQPSGTLRVVVDSTGKLVEVTIYKSSGNTSIDSQAIAAYKKQWTGQVLRQRQATLYVPFSQSQGKTDTNN